MRRVPPRSGRPVGPRVGTALDGDAEAAPEQPVSRAEPPSAPPAAAAVRTDRRGIPAAAGAVRWEVSDMAPFPFVCRVRTALARSGVIRSAERLGEVRER
ncbi:hypothetical protein Shyhy02_05290 [Streptomyces hygroscopicus subsp. hygroscopicus]|nr:hypothetical protein Shyhy02_05290 [Streptomyces hygroscopicus subsp. hygroscopicus]